MRSGVIFLNSADLRRKSEAWRREAIGLRISGEGGVGGHGAAERYGAKGIRFGEARERWNEQPDSAPEIGELQTPTNAASTSHHSRQYSQVPNAAEEFWSQIACARLEAALKQTDYL